MFRHYLTVDRKTCLWAALLTLVIGGVRFCDGSKLLAIARGGEAGGAAISNPADQYLFDSPLKILVLKLAPPKILWISLLFAGLAVLPLLGLTADRRSLFFQLTGVLTLITPAVKVSLQNVGVGDGLTYALIVAAIASDSLLGVGLSFLLLGLWHPQQAFFVCGTHLLYTARYESRGAKPRVASAMLGLLIAGVAYFLYKRSLEFEYQDRLLYVSRTLHELPLKNLAALPVSAFYIMLWEFLVRRMLPERRLPLYALAWPCALVAVSLCTADVTRVLSIIALPALLIPMKRWRLDRQAAGEDEPLRFNLIWVILSIAMPVYSWSGFDIFLWPDLIDSMRRYGFLPRVAWAIFPRPG